jgi:hypothetical protein
MAHNSPNRQRDLFEKNEPPVFLETARKNQLAMLIETLLIEIAMVLAAGEASDDQDQV